MGGRRRGSDAAARHQGNPDSARQRRHGAPRRRAPGHFLQKSPMISGSLAEIDLLLKASYGSSPHCTEFNVYKFALQNDERWGAGVETQKNVRGEIGGCGRVPFNEPYAPSLSTIYDGA